MAIATFKIDKFVNIFENDEDLKDILIEYELYEYIEETRLLDYRSLSELFLTNESYISSNDIDTLYREKFLVTDIESILLTSNLQPTVYRAIIFSFKYGTIKHFFKENWERFLPTYDADIINNKEQLLAFQKALMHEFDRFTDIIDTVADAGDIDRIPDDYIKYLSQLIGFERDYRTRVVTDDDKFRELVKNIIEVYRIKGTNYSFELFFNFLGFNVDIKELWFDKRFYDDGIAKNPYTAASREDDYSTYLTIYKPSEYIPSGMNNPYIVHEYDLTDIRSDNDFQTLLNDGYSVAQILGIDSSDLTETYTFFKTNLVRYNITSLGSGSEGQEFSAAEDAAIQAYIEFLTPIFLSERIILTAKVIIDEVALELTDSGFLLETIQKLTDNLFDFQETGYIQLIGGNYENLLFSNFRGNNINNYPNFPLSITSSTNYNNHITYILNNEDVIGYEPANDTIHTFNNFYTGYEGYTDKYLGYDEDVVDIYTPQLDLSSEILDAGDSTTIYTDTYDGGDSFTTTFENTLNGTTLYDILLAGTVSGRMASNISGNWYDYLSTDRIADDGSMINGQQFFASVTTGNFVVVVGGSYIASFEYTNTTNNGVTATKHAYNSGTGISGTLNHNCTSITMYTDDSSNDWIIFGGPLGEISSWEVNTDTLHHANGSTGIHHAGILSTITIDKLIYYQHNSINWLIAISESGYIASYDGTTWYDYNDTDGITNDIIIVDLLPGDLTSANVINDGNNEMIVFADNNGMLSAYNFTTDSFYSYETNAYMTGSINTAATTFVNEQTDLYFAADDGIGSYKYSDNVFPAQKLDGSSAEKFGFTFKKVGTKLFVGAPDGDIIYIFDNSSGSWQADTIPSITGTAGESFGYSLDYNGTYLIVGAPTADTNNGKFYIYDNSYTLIDSITGTETGKLGSSVLIANNIFVVGEPEYNTNIGAVYGYSLVNSSLIKNTTLTGVAGDNLGTKLVFNQDQILVTAPNANSNEGYVKVLEIDQPIEFQNITSDSASSNISVDISDDKMIIGYPNDTSDTGLIHFYEWNGTTWTSIANFAGESAGDLFGNSVSIDGDKSIVGANNYLTVSYNFNQVGSAGFTAGNAAFISFAIDSTDILYVAYRDAVNSYKASVMKFNGTSWVQVGSAGFTAGQADEASLVFDSTDTPYVAYVDGANSYKTSVMKFNGTSWVQVGSAGFSAGTSNGISLAIDSTDTPYIAYTDFNETDNAASVMKFDGTSWVYVGSVGFTAGSADYTSLAIDSTDILYVAYRDGNETDNAASVMKFDGTSWVQVGSAGFTAGTADYVSLAIDSTDILYVAYRDTNETDNALSVMKFDGTSWIQVGSVGFSVGTVAYPKLAFDSADTPYVAYQDVANANKASIMKFNGTSWIQFGSAGFTPDQAYYNSLAIDSNDNIYIAYQDFNETDDAASVLEIEEVSTYDGKIYFYHLDANYTFSTVGSTGFTAGQANYTKIAVDSNSIPYVIYEDSTVSYRLSAMKFDGTSWVQVGAAGFSAGSVDSISLAIDSNDIPYVAYVDENEPDYAASVMKFDGTNWVYVGPVGFTVDGVYDTVIAFDSTDTPYIVYQDYNETDYATSAMKFDGTSWVQVGSAGFTSVDAYFHSLAIDSNNTLYVAYADGNAFAANVMKFDGTNWVQVGSTGFSAGSVLNLSLAIDNNDVPYIAFQDQNETDNAASVMKFDGTSWVYVGSAGFTPASAADVNLVFNSNNVPFIAYRDGIATGGASMMKFNGSSWEQVGTTEFTAGYAGNLSLTIDNNDTFYIAYQDRNEGDWAASSMKIESALEWQLKTSFTETDAYLGTSVDIEGNKAIAGGPNYNSNDGMVAYYEWNGSSWTEYGSPLITGSNHNKLGYSAKISGNYIYTSEIESNGNRGAIHLYSYEISPPSSTLLTSFYGKNNSNYTGAALDIYNNEIIISSPYFYSGSSTGHKQLFEIYEWNGATDGGTDGFVLKKSFQTDELETSVYSNKNVTINNKFIIFITDNNCFIYDKKNYELIKTISLAGTDEALNAVALDDKFLVFTDANNDDIYIYSTESFEVIQTLTGTGTGNFGTSLDVNRNDLLLIGSPNYNDGSNDVGYVDFNTHGSYLDANKGETIVTTTDPKISINDSDQFAIADTDNTITFYDINSVDKTISSNSSDSETRTGNEFATDIFINDDRAVTTDPAYEYQDTYAFDSTSGISENGIFVGQINSIAHRSLELYYGGDNGYVYQNPNTQISDGSDVNLENINVLYSFYDGNTVLNQPEYIGYSSGINNENYDHSSLAINSSNELHIAYNDTANYSIISVKKWNGEYWEYVGDKNVSELQQTRGVFTSADINGIKFNNSDVLYIVYGDFTNDGITVKYFDGTNWNIVGNTIPYSDSINTLGSQQYEIPIYFDSSNNPYIAYLESDETLFVKTFDGTNWNDIGLSTGIETDIYNFDFALINDIPYVVFYLTSGLEVKYWDGTIWTNIGSTSIASGTVYYSQIEANSSNVPYIVYTDSSVSFKKVVKYWDGTAWTLLGTEGFGAGASYYNDLKFNNDVPYIVSEDSNYLTMMYWDGTTWSYLGNSQITNNTITGNINLVFDTNDDPYIMFKDDKLAVISYKEEDLKIIVAASDNGLIANYDGSSWTAYDGIGRDSQLYNNAEVIGTNDIYALQEYDGGLVVAGQDGRIGYYKYTEELIELDGGNAALTAVPTEGVDGGSSGTTSFIETIDGGSGPSPTFTENLDGGLSYPTDTIIDEIDGGDSTTTTTTNTYDGELPVDSWTIYNTEDTSISVINDGSAMGFNNIYAMYADGSTLIVAGAGGRVAYFDGLSWSNYLSGTNYANDGSAMNDNAIYTINKIDGKYVFAGANGYIANYNSGWTNYNGTGIGSMPYDSGTATNSIDILDSVVYTLEQNNDQYLIFGISNGNIASYDNTEDLLNAYNSELLLTNDTNLLNTSASLNALYKWNSYIVLGGGNINADIASINNMSYRTRFAFYDYSGGVWTNNYNSYIYNDGSLGDKVYLQDNMLYFIDSNRNSVFYSKATSTYDFLEDITAHIALTGDSDTSMQNIAADNFFFITSDYTANTNTGAVYFYIAYNEDYNNYNSFIERKNGSNINDEYGKSISIYGNFVAISAPGFNGETGKVYLYSYNINTKLWDLNLEIDGNNVGTRFGETISLKENILLIGESNTTEGTIYIYEYDGINWNLTGSVNGNNTADKLGALLTSGKTYFVSQQETTDEFVVFETDSSELWDVGTTLYGSVNKLYVGKNVVLDDNNNYAIVSEYDVDIYDSADTLTSTFYERRGTGTFGTDLDLDFENNEIIISDESYINNNGVIKHEYFNNSKFTYYDGTGEGTGNNQQNVIGVEDTVESITIINNNIVFVSTTGKVSTWKDDGTIVAFDSGNTYSYDGVF